MRQRILLPLVVFAFALGFIASAHAANEGQADLDKATELKITANDLRDLNQVVELLESALDKGLDADNTDFAEKMLAGTLLQRATAVSGALLSQQNPALRADRRWSDMRQFAITDLRRVVSLDDKQIDAYMLLGRLMTIPPIDQNGARDALTKVIEADDELPPNVRAEAYVMRGAVQRLSERRQADFDKAIELDPEKLEYRLLRARHYYAEKEFDKALADVDEALKQDPDQFATHELRALVLLAAEKPQEALESFNKASELAPNEVSPFQYRGELYRQLGDTDKALEQLARAIELAPNNHISHALRAELLFQDNKPEAALKDIDAALKIQPGFLQGLLLRVRILEKLDRTDEAITQLEQLAQAIPNEPSIQLQLAFYYIEKNRIQDAIEKLSLVIRQDNSNELALRMRGDQYLSIGKHAEAIADFEAALVQSPEESGVLNNYAWTLATSPVDDLRNGKRAVELATKACELTEYKLPHILSTLAASYAEAGDFDKAIEWAQKAIDLDKAEHEGEHADDLKKELASYQAKKPFRELQQLKEGEVKEQEKKDLSATPSATPAPGRTIDF